LFLGVWGNRQPRLNFRPLDRLLGMPPTFTETVLAAAQAICFGKGDAEVEAIIKRYTTSPDDIFLTYQSAAVFAKMVS